MPAQTIYKCRTADGVVFSGKPCGDDAIKVNAGRSAGSTSATSHQSGSAAASIDIEKFRFLPNAPAEVLATVGPPAASYTHRGTEHWLYPNAVRVEQGERTCPELLVHPEDGLFQINWLPEDMMRKAVRSAAAIAGWERQGAVRRKSFYLIDSGISNGDRKAAIVARIGRPDAKKVHGGNEWWEYDEVPVSAADPRLLTLFLEFEGDVLVSSAGN